ncbi:YceI family protein [Edaphocola aurantiacus]|uniref:YceI family protein n=1 Tax=Edaphocola aurantiacus TaxID=2601682 RepID=UPI001C985996|nr:YceI family protein [Edaphocola aurantiacus]
MANVKWALDPTHSELLFKVKHLMITNVKGEFRTFSAAIDGEDFTSAPVTVKIDTESVFTNNNDRDGHLKSPDFFDAAQYPSITFTSKSFKKVDDDEYTLTGDLTIKDITKEVSLEVTYGGVNKDPWGNQKAGFSVKGKINRTDFGLTWNAALETGGVLVSEEVKIDAEVQFVQQPA